MKQHQQHNNMVVPSLWILCVRPDVSFVGITSSIVLARSKRYLVMTKHERKALDGNRIQSNFNGSNTDDSFTTAVANSF